MTLPPFMQLLAQDSMLRDAYVALLDDLIGTENSLDRVDPTHPVDYQRGKVAALRAQREKALAIDAHRGASEGDES